MSTPSTFQLGTVALVTNVDGSSVPADRFFARGTVVKTCLVDINGNPTSSGATFPFTGIPYSPSSGGTPAAATGTQVSALVTGVINPTQINNASGYLPLMLGGGLSHQLGGGFFNIVSNVGSVGFGASTDTVLSRTAAGTIALGNGTPGDASGTLKLANVIASGMISAPATPSGDPHVAGQFYQDPVTHALFVSQG